MSMMHGFLGRVHDDGLLYLPATVLVSSSVTISAPGVLADPFNAECPMTSAESADGILLLANGLGPMLRWDGIEKKAIPAGVLAPSSPPSFSGSNGGTSSGIFQTLSWDFSAFSPFSRNQFGTFPAAIKARTDAWNAISALAAATQDYLRAHGTAVVPNFKAYFLGRMTTYVIPSGSIPTGVFVNFQDFGTGPNYWWKNRFSLTLLRAIPDAAGNLPDPLLINGVYSAFVRFKDRFGNVSDPSPIAQATITDATTITYTDVAIPVEDRVLNGGTRQIWRTTAGQAQTYFLDKETDDMASTTLDSDKNDVDLQLSESEAFADAEATFLLYQHGVPPSSKPYVAVAGDKMCAAGDRPWDMGTVAVTFGSTTVTGFSTEWFASLAGRFFYTQDDTRGYEVASIDSASTLTLTTPYLGPTDGFQPYAIRGKAERNTIRFTTPGFAEAWPYTYEFSIPEDGDEITGLLSFRGFVFLLRRRSVLRITLDDPLFGGAPGVFPVIERGAVNQQCAVPVESTCWLLDELGVHAFDTGSTNSASQAVQDLFRIEDEGFRILWENRCRFHGLLCPARNLIRWFVCLDGSDFPKHALCLNYNLGRWWIEEYPTMITGSVLATIGNRLTPLVATSEGQVCALDATALDFIEDGAGTTRFKCTASGVFTVTAKMTADDNTVLPPLPELVGAPLAIVSGKGKGQFRRIVSVSGNTITVDCPWLIAPAISTADAPSVFQAGGMPWKWKSRAFSFIEANRSNPRNLMISYRPQTAAGTMDVSLFHFGSEDPVLMGQDQKRDGVTTVKNQAEIEVDLTRREGMAKIGAKDWEDKGIAIQPTVEVQLSGFASAEKSIVSRVVLEGVVPKDSE